MTKEDFIDKRTFIISQMLDNPDKHGIYPTTNCFADLDDLFDEISIGTDELSWPQKHVRGKLSK